MNMMKVQAALQYEHDFTRGVESGLVHAIREVERAVQNDIAEVSCLLASVPEPSNAERAQWPQTTREYVEMLEGVAHSLTPNSAICLKPGKAAE